jgi:uncharacterized membrane protein
MATVSQPVGARKASFAPDNFEKALAVGAILILSAVIIAVAKGMSEWGEIPARVWVHLLALKIALVLTPVMMLRQRGDARHRLFGRIWVGAMFLAAVSSFWLRGANHGGFSLIHVLSAFVIIQAPVIYWSARTHNIKRHRRSVRMMVLGALLIAGFFTFPFDRLLGHWLFS